jgi:hypothetical protein
MKKEQAHAALDRLRLIITIPSVMELLRSLNVEAVEELEMVRGYLQNADKKLLEAIDLLAQSRNAFRSKQVERARIILEELL